MLKNYFLVAIRNLYRNKYYALVNIVGLGLAMALCVGGYVNYQFSRSFNSGHRNVERIAAIASYTVREGERNEFLQHPTPLAPTIAADIPGVQAYCRLAADGGDVRYGDLVFQENLCYVDPGFFETFTFDLREGGFDSFGQNPAGIIITGEIAAKFFGDSTALGRSLSVVFGSDKQLDLTVIAVVAEPPLNSSFYGGLYIPYDRQTEIYGYNLASWNDWTSASFLLLDDQASIARVSAGLEAYRDRSNAANPNSARDGFFLVPMRELPGLVRDVGGPLREGLHPAAIMTPSVIAFLILLLACFNFMNTSIAFAARRFREIGVRKVVGCMRGQLVWQFLGENLLLCLIALGLAAALAEIVVPAYASLWPELDLSFSYVDNPLLIVFLVGMLLFTGIAAGLYPALYVSRFNATAIFRGRQKLGGTNGLIRVLLTAQLALSMTCIVGATILTRNASYIRDFDCGYDGRNTLVVPIRNVAQYGGLRTALLNRPGVVTVGATQQLMNRNWGVFDVTVNERDVRVNSYRVGDNFCEAINLNVLEGRLFDSSLVSDRDQAILVSQALVREAGWDRALGKIVTIIINDVPREYRVIGVVGDIYPNATNSAIRPAIVRLATPEQYQYAVVRAMPGDREPVNAAVEQYWRDNYPDLAYAGFWQDRRIQQEYDTNNNIRLIFLWVAGIALVISTMGLLALVSLNIARRTREIGIRKALGASMGHVCALITREFVVILLFGSGIAVVLGFYLTDLLLASVWEYYCDFGVAPFVVSVVTIFVVAALSVGYRVWVAARSNPVDALRCE